jgi:hypothetical protein
VTNDQANSLHATPQRNMVCSKGDVAGRSCGSAKLVDEPTIGNDAANCCVLVAVVHAEALYQTYAVPSSSSYAGIAAMKHNKQDFQNRRAVGMRARPAKAVSTMPLDLLCSSRDSA